MVGYVIVEGVIREDSEEMTLDRDPKGEAEPALCRPGGRAFQAEGMACAKAVCGERSWYVCGTERRPVRLEQGQVMWDESVREQSQIMQGPEGCGRSWF